MVGFIDSVGTCVACAMKFVKKKTKIKLKTRLSSHSRAALFRATWFCSAGWGCGGISSIFSLLVTATDSSLFGPEYISLPYQLSCDSPARPQFSTNGRNDSDGIGK